MLPAQGLIPLASVVSSRGTDAAVLLQPWTNPIASRKGVLGRGNYVPTPALRGEARVSDTRRITIGSVCREPMVGANREALRAKKPGRQFSLELSLSAQRKGKT